MTGVPIPPRPPEQPIDRHAWTLQKGERCAVALVRQWRSAPGYELRISINDELRWAHVYRSATELQYEADANHRQLGDRGWLAIF